MSNNSVVSTGDLMNTLESAAEDPNSTPIMNFNHTISVIRVISAASASTTPTTNLTTASAANASTTPTTDLTTASVASASTTPTTTATATTMATTSSPLSNLTARIEFTSRETFVADLLNQNSEAFQARSKLTKEQIEPVFRRAFRSFNVLIIQRFREGSIVTTGDLFFNESLPSNAQIVSTLTNAIMNSEISFDIDPNSITVTSAMSNGVSHVTSMLTASCLAMVSVLLSYCW
ncbi:G8 domain-containing protein DDB_G0286311-like [Conger conger]|nr:G8 domain-containing protein DDB_G0286311-like [Conger conger]